MEPPRLYRDGSLVPKSSAKSIDNNYILWYSYGVTLYSVFLHHEMPLLWF